MSVEDMAILVRVYNAVDRISGAISLINGTNYEPEPGGALHDVGRVLEIIMRHCPWCDGDFDKLDLLLTNDSLKPEEKAKMLLKEKAN